MILLLSACDKENMLEVSDSDVSVKSTTYTITKGMTFSELNAVLALAGDGDVVEVEYGTYTISGDLNLSSGVTLKKESSSSPIFDARYSSTDGLLQEYWTWDNDDVTIYGINFRNIRFNIQNASNTTFSYCIFDYGIKSSGTDKTYTQDAYIQFVDCSDMTINGCVFKRRSSGSSGRGIYTSDCEDTRITNCTIGDGSTTGYFVTGINDNSEGTYIYGNSIKRISSWDDDDNTDHGIYAHSFDDITISNNTISGWPASDCGGSIKARNGSNLLIEDNTLSTSGILLYVYSNTPSYPYLKYVDIKNNTIHVSSAANDMYHGIGYYRNTSDSDFYEYSITIQSNSLSSGTIWVNGSNLDTSDFNSNSGGVFDNDMSSIYLKDGIDNSGNY